MYYRVLVASQRFHGKESLTYKTVEALKIGQIVSVPLQNKFAMGIVEAKVPKPSFATKEIANFWQVFLPNSSLVLLEWLKSYYPSPLGLITELFTPPNLTKKLPETNDTKSKALPDSLPPLTTEQTTTLKTIKQSKQQSILLHGDTGTGKTRIYVELAKESLFKKKSVLVLTPEIGLTGPLLETFTRSFGDRVLVTHSGMTPAERRSVWLRASRSVSGVVIVGPRSALFSPLINIGLIVMDEAHDSAYKQEQAPYYQTSRIAAKLANLHGALFVMGSATPLVSDYFTFKHKGLPIIRMTSPAIGKDLGTTLDIVDHRDKTQFSRSAWLANDLVKAVTETLKNGEQALLFLNRRGSARLVLCDNCGWQAQCPHCDVALTYHHDNYKMLCHSCDFSDQVPTSCPSCSANELVFRSIGTKALESEVSRLFPGARISRFDRDTEKDLRLNQQHEALQTGKIDILIGTQSIAKGFDLPKLSLVGVVQADSGLQIPDYTATERTYQLLSQVSGRIGRGHRAGKLFVQTYDPASPLIALALKKDYESFYEQELAQRELYKFPPFYYILKITCSRASSQSARTACLKIAGDLKSLGEGIIVEGPSPRFIEKIAGRHAWHLIVKSKKRSNLVNITNNIPGNYTYDLDPSDLL